MLNIVPDSTALQISLTKMDALKSISKIYVQRRTLGRDTYMALDNSGKVWAWGDMSVILSSTQPENLNDNNYFVKPIYDIKTPQVLKGLPAIKDMTLMDSTPAFISTNFEFWGYVSTNHHFISKPGMIAKKGVVGIFDNADVVLKSDGNYYKWISKIPFSNLHLTNN